MKRIIHHGQMGFNSGMQEFSNILQSINVKYHVSKLKDKNHKIISLDADIFFLQNPTPIDDKNSPESKHRGNIPQYNI